MAAQGLDSRRETRDFCASNAAVGWRSARIPGADMFTASGAVCAVSWGAPGFLRAQRATTPMPKTHDGRRTARIRPRTRDTIRPRPHAPASVLSHIASNFSSTAPLCQMENRVPWACRMRIWTCCGLVTWFHGAVRAGKHYLAAALLRLRRFTDCRSLCRHRLTAADSYCVRDTLPDAASTAWHAPPPCTSSGTYLTISSSTRRSAR